MSRPAARNDQPYPQPQACRDTDDGYEHSAWNDSDHTRVVLFLDVVRPLRRPAADVNRGLLRAIAGSPFLRDARRRHQAWERRFERLAR